MFTKLVHKLCNNTECAKLNVPQEPGLYLCESCQGELSPVYIWDKRVLLVAGLLGGLLTTFFGALAYQHTVNRLSVWESFRILAGLDKLVQLETSGRTINGKAVVADGTVWYQQMLEFEHAPFVRRKEDGSLVFRHRHQYRDGEEFWWQLNTNLSNLYFFSESPGLARLLNKERTFRMGELRVAAPADGTKHYRMDNRPGTEKFVAIYADVDIPELDRMQPRDTLNAGDFRSLVKRLEGKPDVVVYHIELPHGRS